MQTAGVLSEEEDEGVQGPVFISEPPASLVFPNTRGALMTCTAYGKPAPEMDWVHDHDGSPVEEVNGVLSILPNNSLYFRPFSDNRYEEGVHGTKYACSARNTAGVIISRIMDVKAGTFLLRHCVRPYQYFE